MISQGYVPSNDLSYFSSTTFFPPHLVHWCGARFPESVFMIWVWIFGLHILELIENFTANESICFRTAFSQPTPFTPDNTTSDEYGSEDQQHGIMITGAPPKFVSPSQSVPVTRVTRLPGSVMSTVRKCWSFFLLNRDNKFDLLGNLHFAIS